MKRFKYKKKISIKCVWILLIIVIIFIILLCISNIPKFSYSNEKLLLYFLNSNNSYIETDNLFNDFLRYELNLDDLFNSKYTKEASLDKVDFDSSVKPKVYIYNTHDTEEYLGGSTVREAAKLIEHKLEDIGIKTIVEENIVTPYLDTSYSTFYQSYAISRKYIEEKIKKYGDFDLVIDLHRDALDREYSYKTIDGINYAKILFVQGVRYENYKDNLELVTKISDMVNLKYPGVSKGIMIKDKEYQHDNYNQDLSRGGMLLELGSNNSTWEEINNTINILVPIFKEVIDGKEVN